MSEFTMGPMLLNLVLWLPIVGVGLLMLLARANDGLARTITAAVMTVQFALTAGCICSSTPRRRGCSSPRSSRGSRSGACRI